MASRVVSYRRGILAPNEADGQHMARKQVQSSEV